MKPIIEINGLSKKYSIQRMERYLSLRDTIVHSMGNVLRNKDQRIFWALKDIDLTIEEGERIGIIGKNGAGKSTLLKILSRVTFPTAGEAILRGKVASLLEVGTGFHPELTGRENIYLNGSILGLKRLDIIKQFDAIVDFSGVKEFLDVPLKNYSSGMQLRLAFSVAAHLNPEILLIDEVLAVGDIEFQQKCLGKMEEVSKQQGRTILFVSHNLQAINKFCTNVILLDQGKIIAAGPAKQITDDYIKSFQKEEKIEYFADPDTQKKGIYIKQAALENDKGNLGSVLFMDNTISVNALIEKKTSDTNFLFRIAVHDINDQRIVLDQYTISCTPDPCTLDCKIDIPLSFLAPNRYNLVLALIKPGVEVLDNQRNILPFTINKTNTRFENIDSDYGYLNQEFNWQVKTG